MEYNLTIFVICLWVVLLTGCAEKKNCEPPIYKQGDKVLILDTKPAGYVWNANPKGYPCDTYIVKYMTYKGVRYDPFKEWELKKEEK